MLSKFFKRYWWKYLPGIAFLILNSYISSLAPLALGRTIEYLNEGDAQYQELLKKVWIILFIAIASFVSRFIWRYFINGNARNMEIYLRQSLLEKFHRLPIRFFSQRQTGDLMAYAVNDVNAVRQTFGPVLALMLTSLMTGSFALYNMLVNIDSRLTLFSLLPIPFVLFFILNIGRKVQKRFKKVQERFAAASGNVQESFMGIRVTKAYVREEYRIERYKVLSEAMREANIELVNSSSLLNPLIQVFFGLSFMISLIYGGNMALEGQLPLGELIAFNGYLLLIMEPVVSVGKIINLIERGKASMKRLWELFDMEDRSVAGSTESKLDKSGCPHIEIKNLCFSYDMAQSSLKSSISKEVLKNISLDIRPGMILGIVGDTGSGKTTLINLLMKFYDAPRGSIFVDGLDLCDVSAEDIRAAIGYVPQDEFLFNQTIGNNIQCYAEIGTEVFSKAVRDSALEKDSYKFEKGYDSEAGERGKRLSGGQRKRVSIARVLVRDPEILLLDDALSSVDVRTEKQILSNLYNIRGKTILIVSGRLTAVEKADQIAYMEDGQIVELGTHKELLEKKGLYYNLYIKQAEGGENH